MISLKKSDGFDELPADEPTARIAALSELPRQRRRSQFGLRHLMILSVVLAIDSAAGVQAYKSEMIADLILFILITGLTAGIAGGVLAFRSSRWGFVGWAVFSIAPTVGAVGMVGASSDWNPLLMIAAGLFVLPVLVGAAIHITARRKQARQEALLWVLALAADRERPLGNALKALGQQSTGGDRRYADRLAECLDHGLTLPDALDFVRGSVSPQARLMTRIGYEAGTLAPALRHAASPRSARTAGWQSFGSKVAYFCLVLLVIQIISGFIFYFILPKLEAIYRDFGMGLPEMTMFVVSIGSWLRNWFVLPVVAIFEGLLLIYLPMAFSGYSELHVPYVDRLFLRRHSIMVLRCLAMIVEGGRSIDLGFQILARWYPATWVRERLAGVYLAVNQGHDWIGSLRAFGLIGGTDAALLDSARRAGNLSWALRELAEGSARRLEYRLQVFGQILFTLTLLAIGTLVGFLAVAYFSPLVMLIQRLT
jgi:type II secretory pathway component PulF